MRRREFFTLIGSATAWPLIAGAQQADAMRRIGVMINLPEADRPGRAQADALREGLRELGWTEGRNIRIDLYWDVAEPGRAQAVARDVVATCCRSGCPRLCSQLHATGRKRDRVQRFRAVDGQQMGRNSSRPRPPYPADSNIIQSGYSSRGREVFSAGFQGRRNGAWG